MRQVDTNKHFILEKRTQRVIINPYEHEYGEVDIENPPID